ncbi:DEAD/DEAH box helicase [Hyphomicrobium sp.]|uniref:DEAD/DEAH box helicase n=1 Tax=Hyphomicrobium sp. TaxID=82 RepID=UPI000F906138|nr:DEAD/DEAH box helicase [Hyphomicrobium sp.]RUO99355.1 MAG: DEAD/DEAH box helicase [Hyphomicrobium sp.]
METKTFADLGLSPKVQAAITAAGYVTPTPIQAAAIPVAVTGRDILGIAQTGTGKTASFTLPMITRLETGRARARMPRSLILAPTRELAAQVAQSFEKYGINHKLSVALLIGGVSMDDQVKKLDRGVDVLIATPGRLLDHFGRGRVMLMGVEILVIDEADRMLDMGFIPDIEKICKLLPPRRQTLFFSATMPPEITRLVNQFLTNPERIEVAKPATTAKTITQNFVYCPNGEDWAKREVLRNMIRDGNVKNAIIFCNRKRDVAVLHKSLTKHGFNAGALHGDMDQSSRTDTLDKFRKGEIMLLAASDVAARGLDIPEVSHVFNFDLPWAADDYVHRIGRTGRAGHEGHSISLVSPDDLKFVKDIEKITGEAPVWVGEPPSEEDIAGAGAGKRRRGRGGRGQSHGGHERSGKPHNRGGEQRQREEKPRPDQRAERQAGPARKSEGQTAPARKEQPQPERSGRPAAQPRPQQSRQAPRNDQPAVDAWTDEPRAAKRVERPAEKRQPAPEQARKSAPPPPQKGGLGFAENMPAFMRKPSRPMKVPGRG